MVSDILGFRLPLVQKVRAPQAEREKRAEAEIGNRKSEIRNQKLESGGLLTIRRIITDSSRESEGTRVLLHEQFLMHDPRR